MTPERYFRWSIWSPIIVPAIMWIILGAAILSGAPFQPGRILGFLFTATVIGGIPYVILAGVLSWLLRRASLRRLRSASVYAPLLYATFLLTIVSVMALSEGAHDTTTDLFTAAGYYAACALGLGYAYVALVNVAFVALRRAGLLQPDSERTRT